MTEQKCIKSERGTVHYWIKRNHSERAKCIVFTHGLTANHMMFEKQVDYFSDDYTVITWDVPLQGESRPYKDFSYKNCATELKEILDTENISQVILVGMSMGGYPSQEFAVQYPDRVIAFIALDTTPFGLN
ncbi:MAG TPA: alpha/beta hydrolase, partial [Firmicutes bacterium]|nr:alpha/beta hydrolase [Bacillota bacterium]